MRQIKLFGAAAAALAATALPLAPAASAQTGGASAPGSVSPAAGAPADGTFYDLPFGARDMSYGMSGTDVKTLNWLLRGLALGGPLHTNFDSLTDSAVRSLQSAAGIASNGVVNRYTRKAIAARMLKQKASWYGPGFYGNTTACGKRLKKKTVGVAHKKLPCGTRVTFAYRGRWVRAKVIDRGPYVKGRKWDLTGALAAQLGTTRTGTAKVKALVAR